VIQRWKREGPEQVWSCNGCNYVGGVVHPLGQPEHQNCEHPEAAKVAPKQWPYTQLGLTTPEWCPFRNGGK
jgi:hypothetical protein